MKKMKCLTISLLLGVLLTMGGCFGTLGDGKFDKAKVALVAESAMTLSIGTMMILSPERTQAALAVADESLIILEAVTSNIALDPSEAVDMVRDEMLRRYADTPKKKAIVMLWMGAIKPWVVAQALIHTPGDKDPVLDMETTNKIIKKLQSIVSVYRN